MPEQAHAQWTRLGGWKTVWGTLHGMLLLAGCVATFVAFASGLMYLVQSSRLKSKRSPRFGFALPSLEQLERWNRGAITAAFPLLTFGLGIGVALNLESQRAGQRVLGWTDPKVLSTAGVWLVFALLLHARYRPEWRGKRVMFLTIGATAFLAFALLGVDLLLPTAHGVPRQAAVGDRP
jgi:ABC-type uncharacterized transport system permease subunit